jgi:hypothetical protein
MGERLFDIDNFYHKKELWFRCFFIWSIYRVARSFHNCPFNIAHIKLKRICHRKWDFFLSRAKGVGDEKNHARDDAVINNSRRILGCVLRAQVLSRLSL